MQVWQALPADMSEYVRAEVGFFDAVTEVSGSLYPVPKDQRRAAAVEYIRKVHLGQICRTTACPDICRPPDKAVMLMAFQGCNLSCLSTSSRVERPGGFAR